MATASDKTRINRLRKGPLPPSLGESKPKEEHDDEEVEQEKGSDLPVFIQGTY